MNRVSPSNEEESKEDGPVIGSDKVVVVPEKRDRWKGRATFIIAAIGAAIGLGNFWRFPYLSYKHGGVIFFIPYLLSMFLIGIPMLLLELSLGQKFQRGDIGVFRGIFPRAAGIGLASVFCSSCIITYYCVILGWSLYYFVLSFFSPIKWSKEGFSGNCDMGPASEFYFKTVLKFMDDD